VPPMLAFAYNLLQQQDNSPTPFDWLLRRDRTIVAIALLILILLAWFYVGRLAASMEVAGVTGTRMVSTGSLSSGLFLMNARAEAMQRSDMQGPCCCKCWRWKVYGGLGKYLIRTRHYTGQQVTDLWNVGQGCGGPADTKMH
jgi:hypothetical protein